MGQSKVRRNNPPHTGTLWFPGRLKGKTEGKRQQQQEAHEDKRQEDLNCAIFISALSGRIKLSNTHSVSTSRFNLRNPAQRTPDMPSSTEAHQLITINTRRTPEGVSTMFWVGDGDRQRLLRLTPQTKHHCGSTVNFFISCSFFLFELR